MKSLKAFLRFFYSELTKQDGSLRAIKALRITLRHSFNFLVLQLPLATLKLQQASGLYYKLTSFLSRNKNFRVLQDVLAQSIPMPDDIESKDFTVVIPVYGNLGLFEKLLRSINPLEYKGIKLIVIDDCKDSAVTRDLAVILNKYAGSFELIENKKNLGFLKSVNKAIESCNTRFAILLNSDTELPKYWLQRFANAMVLPGVALATALATESGANLTVNLPKGRTWREVDSFLAAMKPKYPDACTAIGYALAIDLQKINLPLFDEDYIDGYGEDSDLHYRCICAGHRSIVVDNLLVKHHSGASYKDKPNLQMIRKKNAETFLARWGRVHSKNEFIWALRQPIRHAQQHVNALSARVNFDSDIVIALPTEQVVAGGIAVAITLSEELNRNGVLCRLLPVDQISTAPYLRIMEARTKSIVATGIGTYWISTKLSVSHSAKLVNLFQGPELFFENGLHFGAFRDFIPKADLTLAVSPYLSNLAASFGALNIVEVALGPDRHAFYDAGLSRKKQLVLSSRLNSEKGTVFSLPLLEHLANSGWSLISVGPTHPTLHSLTCITNLGEVNSDGLRKVLSQSMALLDLSIFEGLGLMPQEALACGCHVIMQKKGGTESVLDSQEGVHWLPSPMVNAEEILKILEELEPFSAVATRSLELGTRDSVHALLELLKMDH